jgi:hypothetical protein
MYIDPIHAGPVALAHAVALATRAPTQCGVAGPPDSPPVVSPRRRFQPLRRLGRWWRNFGIDEGTTADPVKLMLLADPAGRPYTTALAGVLLLEYLRKRRAAGRHNGVQSSPGASIP